MVGNTSIGRKGCSIQHSTSILFLLLFIKLFMSNERGEDETKPAS